MNRLPPQEPQSLSWGLSPTAIAPADLIPKDITGCWLLAEAMCHPNHPGKVIIHVTAKAWFRLADNSGMPMTTSAYLAGLGSFRIDPEIVGGESCEFVVHAEEPRDIVTIGASE